MANSCKKHSYARVRQNTSEPWYVYCEKCGQTFEPKKGVSREEFDHAFDLYFEGQLTADSVSQFKKK